MRWVHDSSMLFLYFLIRNPAVYIGLQALVNWVGALRGTSKPPKVDLSSTYTARFSQKSVSAHNPEPEMHPLWQSDTVSGQVWSFALFCVLNNTHWCSKFRKYPDVNNIFFEEQIWEGNSI